MTVPTQTHLFDHEPRRGAGALEHYRPWPAPRGDVYSHFVVWKTCLVWELDAWLTARGGVA